MTTWNHAHTSASLTVYISRLSVSRTTWNTQTHICQPHWLQISTASLTEYRKHKYTSASLTDYITQLPASLSYRKHKYTYATLTDYRSQLPASPTTGNTNTSASLTDYRTQLPSSLTTANTNTHLPASLTTELNCQPQWLQETQTHIFHYSTHIPRKNTEWSINIQSTHTSRWSVGR